MKYHKKFRKNEQKATQLWNKFEDDSQKQFWKKYEALVEQQKTLKSNLQKTQGKEVSQIIKLRPPNPLLLALKYGALPTIFICLLLTGEEGIGWSTYLITIAICLLGFLIKQLYFYTAFSISPQQLTIQSNFLFFRSIPWEQITKAWVKQGEKKTSWHIIIDTTQHEYMFLYQLSPKRHARLFDAFAEKGLKAKRGNY